jgi:hypothetical protein
MSKWVNRNIVQRTPKSIDVRFAPKATVSCENAVRRFGLEL